MFAFFVVKISYENMKLRKWKFLASQAAKPSEENFEPREIKPEMLFCFQPLSGLLAPDRLNCMKLETFET